MNLSRNRWILGLVCAAAASIALTGCSNQPRWNVLLVTFDTTRADRIGCYGNDRIQTPILDGLARDGVRFAHAVSAVPITAPSHSTILTGTYPLAHGVRDNGLFVLADDRLTLPDILADHGYATAAAVGAYPVTSQFGFGQGFSYFDDHLTGIYEDHLGQRALPKQRLFFDERRAAQVNEAILPWLTAHADQPFFAWVHYFDPHQPFEPAPPYDQLFADDLYNGEIAYADSRLGYLLEHLDSLGVLDRTLVVMTADHGEGLGDHQEVTHGVLAYDSTLHVPLIIRPPEGVVSSGQVVRPRVGTVDIVPTVLDLLDLSIPPEIQGTSLMPLLDAAPASGPLTPHYAENLSPSLSHGWAEQRVLYDGRLKYIHAPSPELYDVIADPGELHDLASTDPAEAARMRRDLEGFIAEHAASSSSTVEELDPEVRARLEALGYLHRDGGGAHEIVERLREGGVPPTERVSDLNDMSAAKHLLFKGRPADALVYTSKLVESDPGSAMYLELHASALSGVGRIEDAWEAADRLQAQAKLSEPFALQLIALTFRSGQRERAVVKLRRALESGPTAPGEWLLASFHRELGDPGAARAALERALVLDPGFVPARTDLGVSLAQSGHLEAAESELLQAIRDSPYTASVHYNYGALLAHDGRLEAATERFERAVALAPRYRQAHHALVAVAVAAGDRPAAEDAYRRLTELAPTSQEAEMARLLLEEPPS